MGDEERQRRRPVAPRVDEVDAETVHAGPEVVDRSQLYALIDTMLKE